MSEVINFSQFRTAPVQVEIDGVIYNVKNASTAVYINEVVPLSTETDPDKQIVRMINVAEGCSDIPRDVIEGLELGELSALVEIIQTRKAPKAAEGNPVGA